MHHSPSAKVLLDALPMQPEIFRVMYCRQAGVPFWTAYLTCACLNHQHGGHTSSSSPAMKSTSQSTIQHIPSLIRQPLTLLSSLDYCHALYTFKMPYNTCPVVVFDATSDSWRCRGQPPFRILSCPLHYNSNTISHLRKWRPHFLLFHGTISKFHIQLTVVIHGPTKHFPQQL